MSLVFYHAEVCHLQVTDSCCSSGTLKNIATGKLNASYVKYCFFIRKFRLYILKRLSSSVCLVENSPYLFIF